MKIGTYLRLLICWPAISPAELTSKRTRLMTSEKRQGVDGISPNLID